MPDVGATPRDTPDAAKTAARNTPQDMAIMGLPPIVKPDPAAASLQSLQPGLGQPLSPGAAGPGGTAPVEGKPIVPNDPTAAVLQTLQTGLGQPVSSTNDPNGIAVKDGKVVPYPFGKVNPELNLHETPVEQPKAVAPATAKVATPAAAQEASPTTVQMVRKLLAEPVNIKEQGSTFNFGDFLKGAGGKLGDFLQRWGMGLQGAPEGKTQGDIQREQAFELTKQKAQAEVVAKQQALDNQYQTQRLELQNQLNIANLPIESKYALQQRLAELDAEYNQQVKLIPLQVQAALAQRQWTAGANPADHLFSQGQ